MQFSALETPLNLKDLLAKRLGLRFDGQPQLLGASIRRLHDLTGLDEATLFKRMSESRLGDDLWEVVCDHVVVSSSRFFRDPEMFDVVEDWLQDLIIEPPTSLAMVSWGAADGREAYSLAILIEDILGKCGINWQVMGFDISPRALQLARQARYFRRQLDGVSDVYRALYFVENEQELWSPKAGLRNHVAFFHALLDDNIEDLKPDVLCCQNTLMYLTEEQQMKYLNWFEEIIRPGGMLLLSPVDAKGWRPKHLTAHQNTKVRAFIKPLD